MEEVDVRNFSQRELDILEFFAKSLAESPKCLKEHLLSLSIPDRARTVAFLIRVPRLYNAVNNLLE